MQSTPQVETHLRPCGKSKSVLLSRVIPAFALDVLYLSGILCGEVIISASCLSHSFLGHPPFFVPHPPLDKTSFGVAWHTNPAYAPVQSMPQIETHLRPCRKSKSVLFSRVIPAFALYIYIYIYMRTHI